MTDLHIRRLVTRTTGTTIAPTPCIVVDQNTSVNCQKWAVASVTTDDNGELKRMSFWSPFSQNVLAEFR